MCPGVVMLAIPLGSRGCGLMVAHAGREADGQRYTQQPPPSTKKKKKLFGVFE